MMRKAVEWGKAVSIYGARRRHPSKRGGFIYQIQASRTYIFSQGIVKERFEDWAQEWASACFVLYEMKCVSWQSTESLVRMNRYCEVSITVERSPGNRDRLESIPVTCILAFRFVCIKTTQLVIRLARHGTFIHNKVKRLASPVPVDDEICEA